MEVPITQFRQRLFELVDQALEGGEVWVKHKGRRVRIVPEDKPGNKLSRITPLEIIVPGADLEDDSWKADMMREWERDWDLQLGSAADSARKVPAGARAKISRKA